MKRRQMIKVIKETLFKAQETTTYRHNCAELFYMAHKVLDACEENGMFFGKLHSCSSDCNCWMFIEGREDEA